MKKKREMSLILVMIITVWSLWGGCNMTVFAEENPSQIHLEEEEEEPALSEALTPKEAAEQALAIKNPKISVTAESAILYNASTGNVGFKKNALKRMSSASTAKLMTAVAACRLLPAKTTFRVGNELKLVKPDSSRAGLRRGYRLSFVQILSALLLPSGCDAAYTLAVKGGRKLAKNPNLSAKMAVKRFEKYVNKTAKELGAVNSNFVTPDGYDAKNHYTCAYDLAKIAAQAAKEPRIYKVTSRRSVSVKLLSGQRMHWKNTNKHLDKKSKYYVDKCIGFKTGTTYKAGACLVSAVRIEKNIYICVILHSVGDLRFADSKKLLHFAMDKGIT